MARVLTRRRFLWFCNRYRHFLWALLVPVFIAVYLIMECFTPDTYWSSYIWLDDLIPFVPPFVLAYYLWFPLLGTIGVIHLFTDSAVFKRYIWGLMIGMGISLLIGIVFPNGQDLRPYDLLPDNLFGRMVSDLWAFDSNLIVMPSMHVYACIIIGVSGFDSVYIRRRPLLIAIILIIDCAVISSTVLIKQHSILDLLGSAALAIVICPLIYILIKKRMKPNTLTPLKEAMEELRLEESRNND